MLQQAALPQAPWVRGEVGSLPGLGLAQPAGPTRPAQDKPPPLPGVWPVGKLVLLTAGLACIQRVTLTWPPLGAWGTLWARSLFPIHPWLFYPIFGPFFPFWKKGQGCSSPCPPPVESQSLLLRLRGRAELQPHIHTTQQEPGLRSPACSHTCGHQSVFAALSPCPLRLPFPGLLTHSAGEGARVQVPEDCGAHQVSRHAGGVL